MSDQAPSVQSGGFLKGYRTYISAFVLVVGAVAGYLTGEATLATAATSVVSALGLIFAANH